MLESMRKATQGVVGKSIMTLFFGLLIASFAIWGIGDVFGNFGANKVATIGGTTITSDQFRSAYQNNLQQYQRQTKSPVTNAQAHLIGLDSQTLGRLIANAALDERARTLGLAVSDDEIRKALLKDPELKDASGAFSADRFNQALRDAGLSERSFVSEQRKTTIRQQIGVALASGLTPPKALVAALARFDTQTRTVDALTLPASAAGDIPAPSPEALKKFFDERKANYRAPEFRSVNILVASPTEMAKPDAVSDADARALYDKVKDARYGTPEKRHLQQIIFPSETEASEALAKIRAGATFDDIVKERGLSDKDIDLGTVAKGTVFDTAVADAGFALQPGTVSDVVKSQFGPAIVRVLEITPANLKPFEEVAADLKKEIAVDRAAGEAVTARDKIEDARVAGKTLAEAAAAAGLTLRTIPAIDAAGRDPSEVPVSGLVDKDVLLRAVFASEIGLDNEPLATRDRGYEWYEVTKIEPARDRTLDEVKDTVAKDWREEEVSRALAAKAADLVKQLKSGATFDAIAHAQDLDARSIGPITRRGGGELPENVVNAIFSVPPDGAGSAAVGDGRMVFKVTADSTPPLDMADEKVKPLVEKITESLSNDVIAQYIAELQRELGVRVNDEAMQAAAGG
jgi:peptidyl-prolyl cis-trans isomerase D